MKLKKSTKLGKPDIINLPITESEARQMLQDCFSKIYSEDDKVMALARVDLAFYYKELERLDKLKLYEEEYIAFAWAQKGFFLKRDTNEDDT